VRGTSRSFSTSAFSGALPGPIRTTTPSMAKVRPKILRKLTASRRRLAEGVKVMRTSVVMAPAMGNRMSIPMSNDTAVT